MALAQQAAYVHSQLLSRVQLFVAPWTVDYWLLCPGNFPGKYTEVGFRFLLQGSSWIIPRSPTLAGGFFTTEPSGKPNSI